MQRIFFGKQSQHLINLCLELSNAYNWSYDWIINGDSKGEENNELNIIAKVKYVITEPK